MQGGDSVFPKGTIITTVYPIRIIMLHVVCKIPRICCTGIPTGGGGGGGGWDLLHACDLIKAA